MIPTSKYSNLSQKTFEDEVIEKRLPSVLVFGAEWSGNSEIMDSMIQRISGEYNHGIQFFKVDVEEQAGIAGFFGVHAVPTIVIIEEGEVKDFIKGFISAHKLRKRLNEIFPKD